MYLNFVVQCMEMEQGANSVWESPLVYFNPSMVIRPNHELHNKCFHLNTWENISFPRCNDCT
uniref:AlNc14C3G473 protein n=1 Tax=Albugo laibachii Nc14 TaxID=890382 RepID=F0VZZ5_9STRA|nr:AlNc14C3G473 [Albugo laibachii Nc14]|eukprot:CCA14366.1 AlNc14C3G473 [Albugo laibachii Nc14]